ncbi:MAG: SDR family NAD(P)-dependent oxidoreductase, partial [Anaerolineales bacterium]
MSLAFDFSGQVAIITGASGGLGAGIARAFAAAGAAVVAHYHRNRAEALQAEIEETGGRCLLVGADVSTRTGAETLITQAWQAFGRADVLVNNAGTYPLDNLLEMTDDAWAGVLGANLTSVFLCTQVFARAAIDAEQPGAVVNIASIEAENPAPAHSHYNAAKAGVVMHTRAAAAELGP